MMNRAAANQNVVQAATKHIASGVALALAGSIAFSGKAIIVKLAYRYGVDAVTLIMYRIAVFFSHGLVVWPRTASANS
jgi:hypothetical protein